MTLLKFPFRKTYYEINDYFPYLLCLQKTTFPNKIRLKQEENLFS